MVRILCESKIERVVVHARGALVTRRVLVPDAAIADGEVELLVPGLTLLAEAGSLRASLSGSGRRVTSLASSVEMELRAAPRPATRERVRALAHEASRAHAELDELTDRRAALAGARVAPLLRPAWRREEVDARATDALAASALLGTLTEELDARGVALEERLRKIGEEQAAAELAEAQSTTANRASASRSVRIALDGAGPLGEVELVYVVPGARWWPVYTLRLTDGGKRALWWMEALVAQASGEDWPAVRLEVSTADLVHDARLPELPSLRFGRAQPPPRRGYRPPPAGLARMFAAYDREFPSGTSAPAPEPPPALPSPPKLAAPSGKGGRAPAPSPGSAPPPPPPPRPSASRPQPSPARGGAPPAPAAPSMSPAPMMKRQATMHFEGRSLETSASLDAPADESWHTPPDGGGAAVSPPSAPAPEGSAPLEPAEAMLDFDRVELAHADDHERRGRLGVVPSGGGDAFAARHKVDAALVPPGASDPLFSRGNYDHRYAGAGRCDVPADGNAHRSPLVTGQAPPRLRFVCVPREAPEVYREVEVSNPFDAPMLSGPVDVYLDGSLLLSTQIEHTDKGGTLRLGLGVEERLRVARNARAIEETAGLLGGSTVVKHAVTIDLRSSLAAPAVVEVMERVPVSNDKTVKVERVETSPPASEYDQADRGHPIRGGHLWKATVPAGGKAQLTLGYELVLSSKNEVVGGNRRE